MAEFFEAFMLICFGVSWPVSVYKSLKSRKTGGKSILFLYLVGLGYLVGIIGKVIYSPGPIMAIYAINFIMVAADTVLYYRNKAYEKKAAAEPAETSPAEA